MPKTLWWILISVQIKASPYKDQQGPRNLHFLHSCLSSSGLFAIPRTHQVRTQPRTFVLCSCCSPSLKCCSPRCVLAHSHTSFESLLQVTLAVAEAVRPPLTPLFQSQSPQQDAISSSYCLVLFYCVSFLFKMLILES